jgi:N-acetylneuraminic acid mutarotase
LISPAALTFTGAGTLNISLTNQNIVPVFIILHSNNSLEPPFSFTNLSGENGWNCNGAYVCEISLAPRGINTLGIAFNPNGTGKWSETLAIWSMFCTNGKCGTIYTETVGLTGSVTPPPPQTAATPMFSPGSGVYGLTQKVTISTATPGATIRYTTNGSAPTTTSTIYTGPLSLSSKETIEAFATAPGYISSAVATAQYTVTSAAVTGEWGWMSGSSQPGQYGVYGALGTPASGNLPGGRSESSNWTDSNGGLWLFGGLTHDTEGNQAYLNDLWEFDPSSQNWTWKGGSSLDYAKATYRAPAGVYGILGVPDSGNVPGARAWANSWTDNKGKFWLVAGLGFDSQRNYGYLNDLWEFDPSTGNWTWMAGSSSVPAPNGGQPGVYGTIGVPAPGNVPGGRETASTWSDGRGDLWLFGGWGFDAAANSGYLNDLWAFNPTNREWAWMGGSSAVPKAGGVAGVYGKLGVPAPGNAPGSRSTSASWIDSSGRFWLFGGTGFDAVQSYGWLNDLWEFDPSTKEWAWMGGVSTIACQKTGCGQPGVYGTFGVPAAGNFPGGRQSANSWTDASGRLWLFGGLGYDSTGSLGNLNDLWEFNPSTHLWTWMGGSDTVGVNEGQPGVYGALGVPAVGNSPGSRNAGDSWTDAKGHLWLFGGEGFGDSVSHGYLNDLWEYSPPAAVSLLPDGLNFAPIAVGSLSKAQTVKLNNGGNAALRISGISLSGSKASSFSKTTTCAATLAVNASCTISVVFRPAAAGVLTATLAITDNAPGSPQTVSLSGVTPISITTTSLPAGATGSAYSAQLAASGGTAPYTWTATGLPPGVSLGSSGLLSGKPTAAAAYTAAIAVYDSGSPRQTKTASFKIVVNLGKPTISSLSPTVATVGGASFTLTVNGTNFAAGAKAKWGTAALSTTFLNANKLTAAVPASLIAAAGKVVITVTTTAGASAGAAFAINPPPSGSLALSNPFLCDCVDNLGLNIIAALAAKDGVGVTGYYLSQSPATPSLGAAGWTQVQSVTNFTYPNATFVGTATQNSSKTVYAWFRNAAGGISKRASATVALKGWTSADLGDSPLADLIQVYLNDNGSYPSNGGQLIEWCRVFTSDPCSIYEENYYGEAGQGDILLVQNQEGVITYMDGLVKNHAYGHVRVATYADLASALGVANSTLQNNTIILNVDSFTIYSPDGSVLQVHGTKPGANRLSRGKTRN